jgi:hypothetical protein
MVEERLWKPRSRKKNKEYRRWRPRKEYYGEMEQFDGSYHKWFEERASECCMLASIDDTTGKITQVEFVKHEGVKPVFGFQVIHAHSPQAKGRIERLFGTLQDRLIKELRLANISEIQEASTFVQEIFIPKFNEKFGVMAQKKRMTY